MDTKYDLTAQEIAANFALNEKTVLRWAKEGKIPCIHLPTGSVRFNREQVNAWLEKGVQK
jgi:excisionase family DNA binding protein